LKINKNKMEWNEIKFYYEKLSSIIHKYLTMYNFIF